MQTDSWNPKLYKKSASFVSNLAIGVVDLLEPQKSEKILDLGCGDGTLALEIAKRGAVVEAVDLSPKMVEAAILNGINAKVMSATNLTYKEEFDAVFSNAVLHWVLMPQKAILNIKRALKQNGRFVAEFGGKGNVANIEYAMQKVFKRYPQFGEYKKLWYFPEGNEYKKLLEKEGFRVEYIKLIPRPTPIDDISNWLELFTNGLTKNLTKNQKEIFKKEVKEILKKTNYSKQNGWMVDYVRLRVKAIKS